MRTQEQKREYSRRYFYANHEARLAYARSYKKTPKAKASRAAHFKAHPEKQKARTLKYSYGITLDQFKAMEKEQNGLCAICHQPETRVSKWGTPDKFLKVDHCAKTGKIRGLLCHRCNVAIGLLYHDIERLKTAIQYLSRD